MPKVSIIIPVYNVEKYLEECLDSVINQTLKDIEIIYINDGSTDKSVEILDRYAKKDPPPPIYMINKENGGYGSACNIGLEKASGEYIAIMEPDDYADKKMYEELYELAKKHDADIVKSPFYINIDIESGKKIKLWDLLRHSELPEKTFTIKEYPQFLHFHPSIWSCIYKKDFLDKNHIRFVEAPGAGWTDNPFQVETMCLAEKIFYTNNPYYYWRIKGFDAAKELKDYNIPFTRSTEIHQWLESNGITDENLLACLYKRELAYIKIVLKTLKVKDFAFVKKLIYNMLNIMDEHIISSNPYISKKERKEYKNYKRNLFITYCKIRLIFCRREIIRLRLNQHERLIVFMGKTVLNGN